MLRRSIVDRHTPPPGLAFGEPDDRLQRSIQYAAASGLISSALEYWVARSSRAMTMKQLLCTLAELPALNARM
jgi:hypothetical protein